MHHMQPQQNKTNSNTSTFQPSFNNEQNIPISSIDCYPHSHIENPNHTAIQPHIKDGEKYSPYRIPPRLDWAQRHSEANRVGYIDIDLMTLKSSIKDICPCCARYRHVTPFKLTTPIKDLTILGIGIPLYFQYIKYCMNLLMTLTIIYCFYNLGYSTGETSGSESVSDSKSKWMKIVYDKSRFKSLNHADKILSLLTVLIIIALKSKFLFKSSRLECENRNLHKKLTPRDYTLMIKGLPKATTETEVRKFFEGYKLKNGSYPEIYRVNFAYYISDYVELLRDKNSVIRSLHQQNLKKNSKSSKIKKLQSKLNSLNLKIDILNRKYRHLKYRKSELFTGVCFITFNKITDREEILANWRLNSFSKVVLKYFPFFKNLAKASKEKFRGQTVFVEEPPEPSDIFWESIGCSGYPKILTRLSMYLASLVIFAVSFFSIHQIKKYQIETIKPETNKWKKPLLGGVIFFIITALNTLLNFILRKLSSKEKHSTLTGFNASVSNKLTTSKWINTCLVLVLANYSVHGGDLHKEMDSESGMIYDVVFVILGSSFITPLAKLLNFSHIYRSLKKRSIRNAGVLSSLTQQEANFWFEKPGIDISNDYSMHTNLLVTGLFFMYIFPLGLLICFTGLCLLRLIDKYCLLRKYNLPTASSAQLIYKILQYSDFIVITFAISQILFDQIIMKKVTAYSWVILAIAILNYISGFHYLISRLAISKSKKLFQNNTEYEKERVKFLGEYDRSNPVTRAPATLNFLKYLQGHDCQDARNVEFFLSQFSSKMQYGSRGSNQVLENCGSKMNGSQFQTGSHMAVVNGLEAYAIHKYSLEIYGMLSVGTSAQIPYGDCLSDLYLKSPYNLKSTTLATLMLQVDSVFMEIASYIEKQIRLNPKNQYYSNLDQHTETLNYSKNLIYERILDSNISDEEISQLKPQKVQSQSHLQNKNYPHNVLPLELLICKYEIGCLEHEFGSFDILNTSNCLSNVFGGKSFFSNIAQKLVDGVDQDQSEVLNLNDIDVVGGQFFQESGCKNGFTLEDSNSKNSAQNNNTKYINYTNAPKNKKHEQCLSKYKNAQDKENCHPNFNNNTFSSHSQRNTTFNSCKQQELKSQPFGIAFNRKPLPKNTLKQQRKFGRNPHLDSTEQLDESLSEKLPAHKLNMLDRFVSKRKEGNLNVNAYFNHPKTSYNQKLNQKGGKNEEYSSLSKPVSPPTNYNNPLDPLNNSILSNSNPLKEAVNFMSRQTNEFNTKNSTQNSQNSKKVHQKIAKNSINAYNSPQGNKNGNVISSKNKNDFSSPRPIVAKNWSDTASQHSQKYQNRHNPHQMAISPNETPQMKTKFGGDSSKASRANTDFYRRLKEKIKGKTTSNFDSQISEMPSRYINRDQNQGSNLNQLQKSKNENENKNYFVIGHEEVGNAAIGVSSIPKKKLNENDKENYNHWNNQKKKVRKQLSFGQNGSKNTSSIARGFKLNLCEGSAQYESVKVEPLCEEKLENMIQIPIEDHFLNQQNSSSYVDLSKHSLADKPLTTANPGRYVNRQKTNKVNSSHQNQGESESEQLFTQPSKRSYLRESSNREVGWRQRRKNRNSRLMMSRRGFGEPASQVYLRNQQN